jgi:hypothetical protein
VLDSAALSVVVAAAVFVVAASAAAAFPELLTMSVLLLGCAFLVQVQAEKLAGD